MVQVSCVIGFVLLSLPLLHPDTLPALSSTLHRPTTGPLHGQDSLSPESTWLPLSLSPLGSWAQTHHIKKASLTTRSTSLPPTLPWPSISCLYVPYGSTICHEMDFACVYVSLLPPLAWKPREAGLGALLPPHGKQCLFCEHAQLISANARKATWVCLSTNGSGFAHGTLSSLQATSTSQAATRFHIQVTQQVGRKPVRLHQLPGAFLSKDRTQTTTCSPPLQIRTPPDCSVRNSPDLLDRGGSDAHR